MGAASGRADGATAATAQNQQPAGARGLSARAKRLKTREARTAAIFSKKASSVPARADAARASLAARPPRGILKQRRRDRAAPQTGKSWLASLLPGRLGGGGERISFNRRVEVAEYTRCVNRDTIPGDGSYVTMGLGRLHRRTSMALAPGTPPLGKLPVEEAAWLTSAERVRALRKCMGDKRFFGAWVHVRRSTIRTCNGRLESRADRTDQAPMPCTLEEAQMRAQCLASEVAVAAAECKSIRLGTKPSGLLSKLATLPVDPSAGRAITLPSSKRQRGAGRRRQAVDVQAGGGTCRAAGGGAQNSSKLDTCKPQFSPVPPEAGPPGVDDLLAWCTLRLPTTG